jgi:hypothetical protein
MIAFMAVSCGYDRFGELDFEFPATDVRANAPLSELREHHYGTGVVIVQPMIFGGHVTATDLSGNFYRTFTMQDETGAVEVYAGIYDLHNVFRTGQRVVIKAEGLAVSAVDGVMRIGRRLSPYSALRVEPFGSRASLEAFVVRDNEIRAVEPVRYYGAGGFSARDCGRLVEVEGLRLREAERGLLWATPAWAETGPAQGVRNFEDSAGRVLAVVTSGYATFAGQAAPTSEVTLTGILLYGKFDSPQDRFALKLRDMGDVK